MKSVFNTKDITELKERINKLSSRSQAQWGKMNVAQMLAHCNVAYEMTFEPYQFKKPKGIKKWILKSLIKPYVVGPKSFKKNGQTSKDFKITSTRDLDFEKERIFSFIDKTQQLGASYFEEKENLSFGKMSSNEWNTLFYKHLNHHLEQFGV